eukprot:g411.t1
MAGKGGDAFAGQPPHRVLDVPRDASMEEVKRAYRRLALKHHPDVKGGCKTTFSAVNEAYNAMVNRSAGAGGGGATASSPFDRRSNERAGDGTQGQKGYGSRGGGAQHFHTPNPYRSKTARAVRGTQGVQGVQQRVVFDEGLRAAIRADNQRALQRHSQRAHSRRNIIACAVPFFLAWGVFEWKQEKRKQELRRRYGRG